LKPFHLTSPHRAWSRLDNAAKIFPSTTEKTDTRVFRFTCELTEEVDPVILQNALDHTIREFPHFLSVMKKGLFWYYLEESSLTPKVRPDNRAVCSKIYRADRRGLLFEITYFRHVINLEVYHVLTDGTGAISFLKTLVCSYLKERYPDRLAQVDYVDTTAAEEKSDDGFRKYYSRVEETHAKPKAVKAYRLKGTTDDNYLLHVIAAHADTHRVLALAKQNDTTLTVYLTALLIDTIHRQMSLQDQRHPVVISVPVNLRPYFPSSTAKNFFGMINVVYDFHTRSGEFSDIIACVAECFRTELTRDRLAIRMNHYSHMERNPFLRAIPLVLKNPCMRIAMQRRSKTVTAVISNVGKITLPEPFMAYVQSFGVFAATQKVQLCITSCGDDLCLGFTSAFCDNTSIERDFIRALTDQGIAVNIDTNIADDREGG